MDLATDTTALGRPPFISKGYYVPMVLANGVDFCQLDFSGSMYWEEHIKGYLSYWYKKGRPRAADPHGIVKLIHAPLSEKGPVQYGDFAQRFDPLNGILHTRVEAYQFAMEIQTLLTDDHTLVELFTILDCGADNSKLRLAAYFAEHTYTNKPVTTLHPSRGQVDVLRSASGAPFFRYRYDEEFEGVGVSAVRVLQGGAAPAPSVFPEVGEVETNVVLGGLQAGDVLLRATTLLDSLDGPEYEAEAWRINGTYLAMPWEEIRAAHAARWQHYQSQSSFACDDADLTREFATSLYVCKASLHPHGSSVSALEIPNNHEMGTYWDIWYPHSGLLRANRLDEAMRIVEFWDRAYPGALEQAQRVFAEQGARFAWVLGADGLPMSDGAQIHNNLIPLINIWEQYRYTMDREIIARRFGMMEDCVRFIISYALKHGDEGYYLKELIGPDESGKQKRNELLTTVITLRGIDILKEAAAALSRSVSPDLLAAEGPFRAILASLETERGYAPYEGGDSATWGVAIAFLHLYDPARFRASIDFALEGCREVYGLGAGQVSRARFATWPWGAGIFAWAMLRNDDPRAKDHLLNMIRYTNFFGGFAEYIWLHGESSREWFVGAHGVFVAALLECIAQTRRGVVHVLPLGVQALPCSRFTVTDIRLDGAWLLSAALAGDGQLQFTLRNPLPEPRTCDVALPDGRRHAYAIAGGGEVREVVHL